MQGALDGGLDIPHSEKRFAGFKKDDKQLDAEVHRKYIFGGHVASYMRVGQILVCVHTYIFLVSNSIVLGVTFGTHCVRISAN